MKIYGNISAETMAKHQWVTLDDYLSEVDRLQHVTACNHDYQIVHGVPTCLNCRRTLREINP